MENTQINAQPTIGEDGIWFYTASKNRKLQCCFGFPVSFPGFEQFTFAVHSWNESIYDDCGIEIAENEWWKVSEVSTGYSIPMEGSDKQESKEEAVYMALISLRDAGFEKVSNAISKAPKTPKSL